MIDQAQSIISYSWTPQLEGDDLDQVLALVTAASEYDDEAGFAQIDPADVASVGTTGIRVLHLPIRARRDLNPIDDVPLVVVAYLRLAIGAGGLAAVSYVVHPDYRSRGLTTLLVEQLGLDVDAAEGWDRTGASALRCWAYSTHPAAERLTRRFGVGAIAEQWGLARPLSGPFALPLEAPVPSAGITLGAPRALGADIEDLVRVLDSASVPQAHRDRLTSDLRRGTGVIIDARDETGTVLGFVWYSTTTTIHLELRAAPVFALILDTAATGRGLGSTLLAAAMIDQRDNPPAGERGAQVSLLRINPEDQAAVRMCRLLGYEQEDSDTCYQVGHTDQPAPVLG
ncbi:MULTISPECIES: GNAT family N-acetyltransferase [Gordonia]|jgi:mycothiol synthase|uniref:GNAT family N-acetyltransferase n=1 Tax=Gordonia TaxID=2053 RepID=UPI002AFF9F79|nr:GNAT family N-acetyltransferase [Gordonia pseudamarae]